VGCIPSKAKNRITQTDGAGEFVDAGPHDQYVTGAVVVTLDDAAFHNF
jgi:hypothetical protein